MNSYRCLFAIFCAAYLAPTSSAIAVSISTVTVGDPGNPNDVAYVGANNTTGLRFGSVAYEYRIGTTEVTNSQYAEFLNFKAASDPLNLYSPSMASDFRGGIIRNGVSGSYTYTPKANMADMPVVFVSAIDAARFANWLNNGQGSSDTETGAYTLLGGTAVPSNATTFSRNTGAQWFIPNEDEWYKAAFYDPRTASEGGPPRDDHYWLYATKSDIPPIVATVTSAGIITNPGANVANYNHPQSATAQLSNVGGAGPESASYYGTLDQSGNVFEMLEARRAGGDRFARGGSWYNPVDSLAASYRTYAAPTFQGALSGFRVASVPEPRTLILATLGAVALLTTRRFTEFSTNT